MDNNDKVLLEKILDTNMIDMDFLRDKIRHDSSFLLSQLESPIGVEITVKDRIENIYKNLSSLIINGLSQIHFNMPITMAIATKKQDEIKRIFLFAAERYNFDSGLQAQIDSDLEEIANKLNRRFTFDEASLIHLIEASKASNIQTEEDDVRKSPHNKRQVLRQRNDGIFYLAEIPNFDATNIYTSGKPIPTITIPTRDGGTKTKTNIDQSDNIMLSAYPGAKDLINTNSPYTIMQQIMKNLFDNLELCVDTYKVFYTKNSTASLEDGVAILNRATLADDSEFEFLYRINSRNLPHLLGIQNGEILSESTKRYFAKIKHDGSLYFPIDERSNALTILKVLLENKERIIADCGLIEENGKLYQLFPWEKIILKTSSFMRGDFFKNCFCLAALSHGLNDNKEEYVTISSLKYNDGMVDSQFDTKSVLYDLKNIKKQKKDFIFRTFTPQYDDKGRFLYYLPVSIDTGKSESIVTNKGERIKTLDRYRNALQGSEGMVVKKIENENNRTVFSPIEQALTRLAITSSLNINVHISEQAFNAEEKLGEMLDEKLNQDLQEILTLISPKKR